MNSNIIALKRKRSDVALDCPWSSVTEDAPSAKERILSSACFLFCHYGFAATGVDAIAVHSGSAKTTLYKHFESKDALVIAVLECEGSAWRRWFFDRLSAIEGSADRKLLTVFDLLGEWFSHPNFYGCPFINAIGEFQTSDQRIRDAAAHHKSHLFAWLKAQALELGAADPDEFTRKMIVLIDGAIVAAQGTGDPSFAKSARQLAETLLRG